MFSQVSDAPSLGSPYPVPRPQRWVRRRPRTAPDPRLQDPDPVCPALWMVFPATWPATLPAECHLQRGDHPLLHKAPGHTQAEGNWSPCGPKKQREPVVRPVAASLRTFQWPFHHLASVSPRQAHPGGRPGVGGHLPRSSVSDRGWSRGT